MTIIRNANGDIIHRSRNLAGLLRHARRAVPIEASFADSPQPCDGDSRFRLIVRFDNGDVATSAYADPIVCARFLNSRRSWPRLAVYGPPAFLAEYAIGRRLL